METNYIYLFTLVGDLNKEVDFISSFYFSPKYKMGLPVGFDYVLNNKKIVTKQGKTTYKIDRTKNELMREVVYAYYNMIFRYVLADSRFSSEDNNLCITEGCNAKFILAIKSNRVVVLNKEEKGKGIYHSIDSLELEVRTMSVYLKKYSKPVLIAKQVLKKGDGSTGTLYLATIDFNLDYKSLTTTIYEKRWKVEEFFRSIKNKAFAKATNKTVKTQKAHFTASMIAFIKLERLKVMHSKNYNTMKSEIWLDATKAAWQELEKLSTPHSNFNRYAA